MKELSRWLAELSLSVPHRYIVFRPGRYGRMDNFELIEFPGLGKCCLYRRVINFISTDPNTETVAALCLLDDAARPQGVRVLSAGRWFLNFTRPRDPRRYRRRFDRPDAAARWAHFREGDRRF
jgi:hypothetical protein